MVVYTPEEVGDMANRLMKDISDSKYEFDISLVASTGGWIWPRRL
ncbi:MAG: hypothetical protein O8C66_02155 [Candidatus Methanoperedens sp.]|nr:hypothetical protein [Candidatus Methanoperedens sp.]MCZ7369289.1 hypothetical protein [Candidatus Methanoperedens sp.]